MLFSVTDGGDFCANVLSHKKDRTFAETATRVYKNHGADVMTDNAEIVRNAVRAALEEGKIDESDIDYALSGLLKARFLWEISTAKAPTVPIPMSFCAARTFTRSAKGRLRSR